MGWLSVNNASATSLAWGGNSFLTSGKRIGLYDVQKYLPAKSCSGVACSPRALGSRNSVKRLRRERLASERVADKANASSEYVQNDNKVELADDSAGEKEINVPSRGAVLQACTITSGLIAGLGILIRQASHIASIEGLPVLDCSVEVSLASIFDRETAIHKLINKKMQITGGIELIAGLVILISSSRYILLKTWPEFAESSNTANQQVLSSLEPLDFIIVAFFPGISEELLFRGALQPLFGSNLSSALVVSLVFGILHLGSGRKYSFAVWASLVGFVYGYATIASSSLVVPMVSHAMNNLVGGILWRYRSHSSGEISNPN